MNTSFKKGTFLKKEENIETNLVTNDMAKESIETNYELNLLEGTEAYYSERYGWTLRRTK